MQKSKDGKKKKMCIKCAKAHNCHTLARPANKH